MRRATVVLLWCMGLLVVTGCRVPVAPASDEELVRELVLVAERAWNECDYASLYELRSPRFRRQATYQEFVDYAVKELTWCVLYLGTARVDRVDVEVTVVNDWAFASYHWKVDDRLVWHTRDEPYRRVHGRWYHVTTDPRSPGFNKKDLPPPTVMPLPISGATGPFGLLQSTGDQESGRLRPGQAHTAHGK